MSVKRELATVLPARQPDQEVLVVARRAGTANRPGKGALGSSNPAVDKGDEDSTGEDLEEATVEPVDLAEL